VSIENVEISRFKRMPIYFFLFFCLGLLLTSFINQIFDFFLLSMLLGSILSTILFYLYGRNVLTFFPSEFKKQLSGFAALSLISTQLFFFSLIPLTIDRSFSVWLLTQIEAEQKGYVTFPELSDKSQIFFIGDGEEIERRYNEQLKIGTLRLIDNDKIVLTSYGNMQVKLNRFIGKVFALNPKYTNERQSNLFRFFP
jgi:hypothetical protein